MTDPTPTGWDSWEKCRDYWALEALFLGQLFDRHPGPRNKKRYLAAAGRAVDANEQCAEPFVLEGVNE